MKVQVEIVGPLLQTRGERLFSLELPPGAVGSDLLSLLEYKKEHVPHIVLALNGVVQHHDLPLADGGQVLLSTLVGGG